MIRNRLQKSIVETDGVTKKERKKYQLLTLMLAMLAGLTYICCTTFSSRDCKLSSLADKGSQPFQESAEGLCKTEDIL